MTQAALLWLLVLLPLAGSLAVLGAARTGERGTRRAVRLTGVALVTLVLTLALGVWAAVRTPTAVWALWGPHLTPQLAVAGLGRTMVVLVPLVATPVVLYTGAYARDDRGLPRLLALLTAFTGVMELLVTAGDFLTLLVAWELVGVCSWALIGYSWRDAAATRSARNAFLTTRVGDLGLYLAAAAAYVASGSLAFASLASVRGPALGVVVGGVLLAAAAKSAQLPFSPWLFAAMAGPTPASALLHSATMVAAGAYLLARLAPALAPVGWFAPAVAIVGLATALAGGVVASVQTDFKRVLAASTSAQYGLMFVAVGAGFPGAAGVHLVAHAAFKALLFLGAGVAAHAGGTLDLGTLARRGLGRAIPRVAGVVAIGALALAAIPPLGAAWSKAQLATAAANAPFAAGWLTVGVFTAALLSAFYAARVWLLGFGVACTLAPDAPSDRFPIPAAPAAERWAMGGLAALSVALGAWYLPRIGSRLAGALAGGRLPAAGPWWELLVAVLLAAAGFAAAWWLGRRGQLVTLAFPAGARAPAVAAAWFGLPTAGQRLVVDPTLALAHGLAAFDDRVVDAGVRAAGRVGALASSALAWWAERGVDGLVAAIGRATLQAARGSQVVDDRGIDRTVEGLAREVGVVGTESRRLQTGLTHDYYRLVAVGALAIVLVAAVAAFSRHVRLLP